jgi:hypothetical protein
MTHREAEAPLRIPERRTWILVIAIVVAITTGGAVLIAKITPNVTSLSDKDTWATCVQGRLPSGVIKQGNASDFSEAETFCYALARDELRLNDFSLRRAAYSTQPFETKILMWLVVVLVASGVALAWYQVWKTYELALRGQQATPDPGGTSVDMHGFVVKSSVVGVSILAISFAFFGVYVKYVYAIDDTGGGLPVVQPPIIGQGSATPPPSSPGPTQSSAPGH